MIWIILIALFSSLTSYILYKKIYEITLIEAFWIFFISFVFSIASLYFVIDNQLQDQKIESWFITSKVFRESYKYEKDYTYDCYCTRDKDWYETCQTCHWTNYYTEPKRYYLIQSVNSPVKNNQELTIQRLFSTKWDRLNQFSKPKEFCYWDCNFPSSETSKYLEVSYQKYENTKIWKTTSWYKNFKNYVKESDFVINTLENELNINYPIIQNYDEILRGNLLSKNQNEKLNLINSKSNKSNINILIYELKDENIYEKLIRNWKGGKPNDFIIIKNNNNFEIISWDNYQLKEKIKKLLYKNEDKTIDWILSILENNIYLLKTFKEKDFENYSYLDTKLTVFSIFILIFVNLLIILISIIIFFNNNENKNRY